MYIDNPGFAKSRPAAHGPPRPSGPRPTAHGPRRPGGPVARRPTQFCCLAVNPRACSDNFASGLGAQMKDGEFEFVYHFNNHFNPFKLTVVHFARPNPMQICACAWIYRWTEKPWKMRSGLPGLRASGPPGRRAVAGRGRRAAGPSGRWATGPWRAVGRGPLGRGSAFSKTLDNPCCPHLVT